MIYIKREREEGREREGYTLQYPVDCVSEYVAFKYQSGYAESTFGITLKNNQILKYETVW